MHDFRWENAEGMYFYKNVSVNNHQITSPEDLSRCFKPHANVAHTVCG